MRVNSPDGPLARERRWWSWSLPHRRPALGAGANSSPIFIYVALGAVLGPSGVNVLTYSVLDHAATIAWVALAVIGVFIGLALRRSSLDAAEPTVLTASVVGLMTIGVIVAGVVVLVRASHLPATAVLPSSVLIGICASVSAARQTTAGASRQLRFAARVADLDDVPLLLVGTAFVAVFAGPSATLRLTTTVLGGAALGLAGWLLFESANDDERGLFVTGTVLLLAGLGAYLATSPLLSGCAAAVVWRRAPGEADRITERDLRALQPPLMALLLIMAGAMTAWTMVTLWAAAFVIVLRLAAKLLASVVAERMAGIDAGLVATILLQPGAMGIAFAVNVRLALGANVDWVVSTVTASLIASEIIAGFLPTVDEEEM